MSKKVIKINGLKEKLFSVNVGNTFSLLTAILYLSQDIEKKQLEEKSIVLLKEIKDLLQSEGDSKKENPLERTIKVDGKNYYLFEKIIRINFSPKARLFDYNDYIDNTYTKERKYFITNKHTINELVNKIRKEKETNLCQEAISLAQRQEGKKKKNFLPNLLGDLYKNFYLPSKFISQILKINIILLNKEEKTIDNIIEHDIKYDYLIMTEKNGIYEAVISEEKTLFSQDDDIINNLKTLFLSNGKDEKEDKKGLSNIMEEINNQDQDIKDYVAGLGLEEA